jgi:hypothetical protein
MITFFSQFAFVSSQKRHFFGKYFGENIFKIITSVPGRAVGRRGFLSRSDLKENEIYQGWFAIKQKSKFG